MLEHLTSYSDSTVNAAPVGQMGARRHHKRTHRHHGKSKYKRITLKQANKLLKKHHGKKIRGGGGHDVE